MAILAEHANQLEQELLSAHGRGYGDDAFIQIQAEKITELERQLAQSEERVKALTEGLDKLTAWGMYCPDWADRNSKDEYAKDFMAALALLSSSKTN